MQSWLASAALLQSVSAPLYVANACRLWHANQTVHLVTDEEGSHHFGYDGHTTSPLRVTQVKGNQEQLIYIYTTTKGISTAGCNRLKCSKQVEMASASNKNKHSDSTIRS